MDRDLRGVLIADAAIGEIIGFNDAAERINWAEHPQGEPYPALVLHGISLNGSHTQDGPDKLFEARVQVDVLATDDTIAGDLGRAVRRALDGYRGGSLRYVRFAGLRSGRDDGPDRLFRRSVDFIIQWSDEDV
ncbi:DUF3168 domain-containing protein [Palleronia sp. LCG004]|uniref:tail completion protein gp17 n=1 Tax=Palleronia sp. LCG004 TaxID=3079304 RepID=UPI002943F2CC|nr:DUF3168 domain-containing protein [Palleronia sp. LCG004]WOI54959.1 DUF3168 domain-containing protein [Palleronia sp. LCG004]